MVSTDEEGGGGYLELVQHIQHADAALAESRPYSVWIRVLRTIDRCDVAKTPACMTPVIVFSAFAVRDTSWPRWFRRPVVEEFSARLARLPYLL
ncbi:hypothetical protein PBRA_002773 [Plasmodiophora brassicae]|uniref:Uncharacterized protein n=1 Tax=Plasmodiophora brassicae TaxID=37360 RepID=A0A0G4J6A3_PLABS|nr:hypothetical protein PBRA_002773 [Plasmodiophora brassicae]